MVSHYWFVSRPASSTRPDEILNAALTIFDQVGFDAARVDDIAAAAGCSKGGLYLHFKSKTAILEALIARDIAPIATATAALAQEGRADPLGTLRLILGALPVRLNDPRLFAIPRLVIAASSRFPDIAEHYRREVFGRVQAALTALVADAMARGQLRAADPAVVCRALMGSVFVEAMRRHVFRDPDASPEVSATQLEALLCLFTPDIAQ